MLDIVYSPRYLEYDFGPGHPFTPLRWEALEELIRTIGPEANWVQPDEATDEDVLQIHSLPFVEAVKFASTGMGPPMSVHYGLGTGDVPVFFGMHEASLAVCGGTVCASERIASGQSTRVLQLGGGLHHAMPDRAAGFCVYNDVALGIRRLKDSGHRVAFVDIDVHHSDGVQEFFYDDPDVLTVSMHQSGSTLFPGTGFVGELGAPGARGAAVNVPLSPGTDDEGYLAVFDSVVPAVLSDFEPDVIVVEAGADAHFADPLADVDLSTRGYDALFGRLLKLADEHTTGRILFTLGGGYGFDATLRIWTLLAFTTAGEAAPPQIPQDWVEKWTRRSGRSIRRELHDDAQQARGHRAAAADAENRRTVEELKRQLDRT